MDAASCCLRGVDDDASRGGPTASPSSLAAGHHPSSAPLVLIVMENHEYSDVLVCVRRRIRTRCFIVGGTTRTTSPSPTLRSRTTWRSRAGRRQERFPTASRRGKSSGPHRLDQMTAARLPWGVYEGRCPPHATRPPRPVLSPAEYELKHNPATPFDSVYLRPGTMRACPTIDTDGSDQLPAFSFITPNECRRAFLDLATGDYWLSQQVPPLLAAGADVLITYDEGTTDLGVHGAGGGRVCRGSGNRVLRQLWGRC